MNASGSRTCINGIINARNLAHDFGIQSLVHVCVATLAGLAGEMAPYLLSGAGNETNICDTCIYLW